MTAVAAPVRERHTARWTAISVGVVVVLFVGLLATRKSADTTHADSPLLGKQAPATSGVSFSGQSEGPGTSLAGYRGKYVLVNFFASWCIPCRDEQGDLKTFNDRHAAAGDAAVLGVVYD